MDPRYICSPHVNAPLWSAKLPHFLQHASRRRHGQSLYVFSKGFLSGVLFCVISFYVFAGDYTQNVSRIITSRDGGNERAIVSPARLLLADEPESSKTR